MELESKSQYFNMNKKELNRMFSFTWVSCLYCRCIEESHSTRMFDFYWICMWDTKVLERRLNEVHLHYEKWLRALCTSPSFHETGSVCMWSCYTPHRLLPPKRVLGSPCFCWRGKAGLAQVMLWLLCTSQNWHRTSRYLLTKCMACKYDRETCNEGISLPKYKRFRGLWLSDCDFVSDGYWKKKIL